jgi:2,4-dienoyl-CoA reductase-like NADH-dependent reductase (Old Yellow Enzyme family)
MVIRYENGVIDHFNYNQWAVNPADMVGDNLLRDLRQSGRFRAVFSRYTPGEGRFVVRGTRSPAVAERIVAEGTADFIALSRPLIREAGLINRWKSGDTAKSACISCNRCFGPGVTGQGVYCVDEKRPA